MRHTENKGVTEQSVYQKEKMKVLVSRLGPNIV